MWMTATRKGVKLKSKSHLPTALDTEERSSELKGFTHVSRFHGLLSSQLWISSLIARKLFKK